MNITRRGLIRLAATTVLGAPSFLASCARGPRKKTVNFFNWADYIGKDTIPVFEKETGIKVNYDVYSSEEEMFSRLKAGVQGYDLIVATDYMITRLKSFNLISPVPHDQLKNLDHIDPRFRDPVYDPGLSYTVPYLWGTTGIGYNKKHISKPPISWWALWDENYKGRISMLDNMRDGIGCALLLLGLPPDSNDPAQLNKARDLLIKQRKLLKQYSSSTYIDNLSSGEIWIAQGWSGDVLQAAKENNQVDYVVPKEGSFIWVDSLCLVRGSNAQEETLRFIDHLLKPEMAAGIANTVRYATANAKAKPLLDVTLLNDPRIYPTRAMEKRLQFYSLLDPATDEAWNQLWQDIKVM